MKINFLKPIICCGMMLTSSCSSLWPFGNDKVEEPAKVATEPQPSPVENAGAKGSHDHHSAGTTPSPAPAATPAFSGISAKAQEELLLKQAQIISRMEEIEAELIQQREKIRLLKQGLLTGIAPDELKRDSHGAKKMAHAKPPEYSKNRKPRKNLAEPKHESLHESHHGAKEESEDLSISSDKLASHGGESEYKVKMQVAKEHYQSGRFGLAIADFAGITREFGDKIGDGEVRVWLGRSYLGLKEYGTARSEYESYLKSFPQGEYAGSVRLDLAKSYVGMGLKERARGELRRVIKDFEGQDISETASLELKNLNGGL